MTNSINRRQAVKALVTTAALTATATTALASSPDADQHLIDLFDEWRGLQRAILDAQEKSDLAEFAASKELDKNGGDETIVNQSHNLPELLRALADVEAKQKAVETELVNTPAKGLTGVQVKLSLWAFWNFDDGIAENDFIEAYPYPENYAIKQALIDLQRLTGQTINAAS